ncbi:Tetratricopeptide repeat protein [Sulfidibacter corallicola]|uniref:Tetratricopeptide repeat protein n=1 Tax=Sulfidibacter corallicola TaxID=2818388 RepID=A0A8A4TNP0_SULCO|nr:hypothetical protein [Sulfidibacter corallicola]QTD50558.1 tetratricopeptide repeat protein [Sulfidibacter corallicola]
MTKPFLYSMVIKSLDDDRLYSAHGIILAARENGTLEQFAQKTAEPEEEAARLLKINLQSRLSKSPLKELKVRFEAEGGRLKTGLTGRQWKIHTLGEEALELPGDCPVGDRLQEWQEQSGHTRQGIADILTQGDAASKRLVHLQKSHDQLETQRQHLVSELQSLRHDLESRHCLVPDGMTAVVTKDEVLARWLGARNANPAEGADTRRFAIPRLRFSRKLMFAFVVALVVSAATIVEKSSFHIRKEKGAEHALEFLIGLGDLSEKQQFERAALEMETGNVKVARQMAEELMVSDTPTVAAASLDLLATIHRQSGDIEAAREYLDQALGIYRSDDAFRSRLVLALVHRAHHERSLEPLAEAESLLREDDPEYWYLHAEIVKTRMMLTESYEEAIELALIGIEAAKKNNNSEQLGWFYRELALYEIYLGHEGKLHYLEAQKYASKTKNLNLYYFSLIPQGMLAKRNGDETEYDWIVNTLKKRLKENPDPALQRNLTYLTSWEP